ncbi:glutamine amidotransferase [Peribacillus deserti]|uniref:Imidazole glycerol phosphate synthase subunit HisH n=1 Tax=Peribacillus deserti TaxID=673318 RepID=A0ABS2QDA6_9BACI|nr:imidazole glycerol phosphate synthase subunit HisH [Peribacillus deserti]MBM7690970.1 glutamine amidotransferase [Peribacillus deserti]
MIGIVDYGMGNLFSVSKALERLGADYFMSSDPEKLAEAKAILLPGVGAFKDAMDQLNSLGLTPFLKDYAVSGRPLLGICLGMQLLFENSNEYGFAEGLSLLPGTIRHFPGVDAEGNSYKVPHMGWNKLKYQVPSPLLDGIEESHVYFVHSYLAKTDSEIINASADYGEEVPAIVSRNNVMGMQFHPEKSGETGMALLRNFINMSESKVTL